MTRTRGPRAVAGLMALAVAVAAWGVAPATSSTSASLADDCPTVLPLDQVRTGMEGTAFSVTQGRTPSAMDVEVLGILRDAVGPGRDIIIVDLSGPVVTAAGGLWAGASGSPVFFRSGGEDKLAGAIAYGLAGGGSTLAGLTPAEDMAALLGLGGPEGSTGSAVEVPRRLAARMAEATGLSITQTASLTRLKTPLAVSGLTDRGLRHVQAAIDRQGLPFIPFVGSSASSSPQSPTGRLRAGDSFVAAMSLGDVTVAGIGTATIVCDGRAVAFGHPFNWTGETTMAVRAADTVTIVRDAVFGSYKLANVAENLGTLTQDRLAGVVARLGAGPVGSPVTSTVTDLDTGRTRSGRSEAVLPEFLPFLAFDHLFSNVDVTIDRIGPGNAEMSYSIRGTRDGGRTWALTRSSHYASEFDISFDSVFDPAITAEVLQGFDGEDIQITSIDVPRLDIESAFEQYSVSGVLAWNGSRYVRRNVVAARPGRKVRLRVLLKPAHARTTKAVDFSLRVPATARQSGYIEVFGGGSGGVELPCFIFEEECAEDTGQTFDQLLASFQAQPRGDALIARLRLGGRERIRAAAQKRQDAVVVGGRAIGFRLIR